jgi:hypothetical protein
MALDSVRYGVKADQAYGFVSSMRTRSEGGAPDEWKWCQSMADTLKSNEASATDLQTRLLRARYRQSRS